MNRELAATPHLPRWQKGAIGVRERIESRRIPEQVYLKGEVVRTAAAAASSIAPRSPRSCSRIYPLCGPSPTRAEAKLRRFGGLRDRAILAVLLYHALRREEAALLQMNDIQERCAIQHLKILGKGGKIQYLPLHPLAPGAFTCNLERSGHHYEDKKEPLFQGVARPIDWYRRLA